MQINSGYAQECTNGAANVADDAEQNKLEIGCELWDKKQTGPAVVGRSQVNAGIRRKAERRPV